MTPFDPDANTHIVTFKRRSKCAMCGQGVGQAHQLASLTPLSEAARAPGRIDLTSYKDGQMFPSSGADHLIWTVAIGKDHTATVLMHKDDYAALQKLAALDTA